MKPKINDSQMGKIKIGHGVYATMAAIAARTTNGIASLESTFNDGVSRFFGSKHDYEGVKVSYTDAGELHMTVYIRVSYGYRIPDLALRLQEKIRSAVMTYTGIKVNAIDVVVQDIIFDSPLGSNTMESGLSPIGDETSDPIQVHGQETPEGSKDLGGSQTIDGSQPLDTSAYDLGEPQDATTASMLEAARQVVLHCPGIHSLSPRLRDEMVDEITARFGKKNLPGINYKKRKDGPEINVYVRAFYGYDLIAVAKDVQEQVRAKMDQSFGLQDVKVDVHMERLVQED